MVSNITLMRAKFIRATVYEPAVDIVVLPTGFTS
jgi:hypothetical protein